METPETNQIGKYAFKNNQNQEIIVNIAIQNKKLSLSSEINENILNKKKYSTILSFEEIKEKNKFFFLCQSINDLKIQLEILLKENKGTFRKESNQLIIIIPTNMALAPEISFGLKEIEKNINTKVEELNDYIINTQNNYEKNFALILKENKEMKEKISDLENQIKILNLNFGFLPSEYFDKIKNWIGGNKEKIGFNLIFKLKEEILEDH